MRTQDSVAAVGVWEGDGRPCSGPRRRSRHVSSYLFIFLTPLSRKGLTFFVCKHEDCVYREVDGSGVPSFCVAVLGVFVYLVNVLARCAEPGNCLRVLCLACCYEVGVTVGPTRYVCTHIYVSGALLRGGV